uniref:Uncharacterized protein n=1 Tax=Mycena chlorophos TaxID=658473 RepID=A0ABQ0L7P6_MYCCL|nr:predicted protein [Mycena chlorophos]
MYSCLAIPDLPTPHRLVNTHNRIPGPEPMMHSTAQCLRLAVHRPSLLSIDMNLDDSNTTASPSGTNTSPFLPPRIRSPGPCRL